MGIFNIPKNNPKRRFLSQDTRMLSLKRPSELLRTFSATFGSLQKIIRNVRKFQSRQDENAFDLEIVGRYTRENDGGLYNIDLIFESVKEIL